MIVLSTTPASLPEEYSTGFCQSSYQPCPTGLNFHNSKDRNTRWKHSYASWCDYGATYAQSNVTWLDAAMESRFGLVWPRMHGIAVMVSMVVHL